MKKITALLFLAIAALLPAREFEYALVKAPTNPEFKERAFKRTLAKFPADIKVLDVSTLANADELKKYKRIFIYDVPRVFTLPQLEGIEKFVSEGGLLITCSIISDIDVNGDGKGDFSLIEKLKKRKAGHPRSKDFPPTGVLASSSAQIKSVTAKLDCPLTDGFKVGEARPANFNFRMVKQQDGTVVMSADAIYKNKKMDQAMPLITIRNSGKGTFVFMPFEADFLKNALSAKTLNWLTDQE